MSTKRPKPRWYWHVHHQVLAETSANIQERIDAIKNFKPENEQATRLRLMKPVKGIVKMSAKANARYKRLERQLDDAEKHLKTVKSVPASLNAKLLAAKKLLRSLESKARKIRQDRYRAQNKISALRYQMKAFKTRPDMKALEALHKKECKDCPWDGKTIFPEPKPEKPTT